MTTIDAEKVMQERDNRICTCGHKSIGHGSFAGSEFVGVGNGPCGIDRDTRNAASGYLGDKCLCIAFTEKEKNA